jgi:hypothetical protein
MNLSMMALNANRMEKLVASPTTAIAAAAAASGDAHKSKEVAPFLKNLRKMLDLESDEILRWTPNGRAFEIHDMDQMMDFVLPKYFKHRKYTSFQRQLNYFNFKKWTKSKAVVCTFSNEFFLRDQPELAWRIARKKSAQLGFKTPTGARRATHVPAGMTMKRVEVATYGSGAYHKAAEDMAIMVPRSKMGKYSGSYPSPTDMDMMLAQHDVEAAHRYYHHAHPHTHHIHAASYSNSNSIGSHAASHEMESLDWIDNFLPSLENHLVRGDDQGFLHTMGHPHHHSYLRSAHYAYPSLQPPSSDYVSMASM